MSEALISDLPKGASVTLQVHSGIARLTLNRPTSSNAIDLEFARAFRHVVAALSERDDVRAVILSGRGKTFCVGGDLKSFAAEGPNAPAYVQTIIENFHAGLLQLVNMPAPVIAGVQGAAAGAGLGLALAADIVIAADDAKFVMAYTNAGVTPDGGTTWILPRLIGLHRALDLTLRNRVLTAHEAHQLGLVAELCPSAELGARVNAIAESVASGPTNAFAQAKRLLRQSFHTDLHTQLDAEGQTVVASFATADGQEGARAFSERRAPAFHGGKKKKNEALP
jgi:2-(1,2-epoxy-1,2-dihydrophenyl)acetyl-CoA isomerase